MDIKCKSNCSESGVIALVKQFTRSRQHIKTYMLALAGESLYGE